MPECVYASSFWLLNLSASQTVGFSWCVGNPFGHFQLLKQGRSGQINTLSFILMAQRRGHISRSLVQKDCVWVCTVCVFKNLWLRGRATLHFIYFVCQLLLPMGAGLVEGTEMCFSHVCTSKRTVQIPAPRGPPRPPKLSTERLIYLPLWPDLPYEIPKSRTVLLPSIFSFTQREVCWLLIHLRNWPRDFLLFKLQVNVQESVIC